MLPPAVRERAGVRRSQQLGSFITGVVQATAASGQISMFEPLAESLEQFRAFNYEQIYMRPASLDQSESVIRVLRALVEYYSDRPNTIGEAQDAVAPGSPEAVLRAVTWVGGMTDRYAFAQAQSLLNWSPADLPQPC